MKIAVITGASSGMGRDFVYAIDKEYALDEIWVIARRKERLEELQEQCETKIRPLALDLSDSKSFEIYQELLKKLMNQSITYFKDELEVEDVKLTKEDIIRKLDLLNLFQERFNYFVNLDLQYTSLFSKL